MSNPNLQAFVEADIINPRTGSIKVYNPLVITEGTQPPPAGAARVPRGDVVAIMFGFNGGNLLLTGTEKRCSRTTASTASRVLLSQVAYCNSPAFYRAANRDIARGVLKIPPLATGDDGQPCPLPATSPWWTRPRRQHGRRLPADRENGRPPRTGQGDAAALSEGPRRSTTAATTRWSQVMDPALGCARYRLHDKTAPARCRLRQVTPTNCCATAARTTPVALVPLNDPMTQVNGHNNRARPTRSRYELDQALIGQGGELAEDYCEDMMQIGIQRVQQDSGKSPTSRPSCRTRATTCSRFMAAPASASFENLGSAHC